MFEKGDIVECVNDSELPNNFPLIKVGSHYTVANVHPCKCNRTRIDIGLYCKSTDVRFKCDCGQEYTQLIKAYWFSGRRFRKIGTLYRTVEIASEIKSLPIVSETSDVHNLKMKG